MPRLKKLCVAKRSDGRYYEVLECDWAYKWRHMYSEVVPFERHPLYNDILLFSLRKALRSGEVVVYGGFGMPIRGEAIALCGVYGKDLWFIVYDAGTHWLVYRLVGEYEKDRVNLVPKSLGVEGLGEALMELVLLHSLGGVKVLCNDRELERQLSHVSLMAELVAR